MGKTADGGYIAVGSTDPMNNSVTDGWVVKMDNLGTVQWQKILGGTGGDGLVSVQQAADGGYIVGGNSSSSTSGTLVNLTSKGSTDAWVVKLDGSGNTQWQGLLGGAGVESVCSIRQTSIGSYVFVGYATSSNTGTLTGVPSNGGYVEAWLLELGRQNTIKGTVFVDGNKNGVKDAGESLYTGTQRLYFTHATDTLQTTASNGSFLVTVDTGSYKTSLYLNLKDTLALYNGLYKFVPSVHTSTFNTYDQTDSFTFALQPMPQVKDVQVNIIPVTPAKPGFTATYRMFYKNVGNVSLPYGYVQMHNDPRLNFVSSRPEGMKTDTLISRFSNFNPGDTASVLITFSVPLSPRVNSGDTLYQTAFPNAVDSFLFDRTTYLKQVVVSSFDPNDKTENNGGQVPQSFITDGSYLQCTVRFQNTGTGSASVVVVRDTLGNRVDASSLQVIAASHPYTLTADGQNNLAFQFDNIQLPPSSWTNRPATVT